MKTSSSVQTGIALLLGLCAGISNVSAEFPAGGFQAGEQWRPVNLDDLIVRPGTALDFSFLNDAPAGKYGPVIVNTNGQLAFAARPGEPVRFLCNNENMPLVPYLRDEDIEAYAEQMQRAGYNAWRPHSVDSFLAKNARADGTLDPGQLAVWDRMTVAMKKRGIYLYLDLTTYGLYLNVNPWTPQGRELRRRTRIYWDAGVREACAKGMRALLEHVNPHTGLALKDDPMVLVMQFRNESGLIFCLNAEQREKLAPDPGLLIAWHAWLKKRHRTTDALREAWTVRDGDKTKCYLKAGQTIDDVEVSQFWGSHPATDDFYRFAADAQCETLRWFMRVVRDEIGTRALVTDYNVMPSVVDAIPRELLPVVDNHSYHEHPSAYMDRGSRQTGGSTIAVGSEPPGNYLRTLAGTRHLGRPFMVSEVGQPFWNPWRHEIGLFLPAFAALQDWGMISQFALGVTLRATDRRRHPLSGFNVALDPPCKAAERMSALLYRRGDVSASPHRIEVRLDRQTIFDRLHGWRALPASLTQLSLLAGFGVRVEGVSNAAPRAPYRASLSLNTGEGAETETQLWAASVKASGQDAAALAEPWVRQLREQGILSKTNRTDLKAGLYESGTGQMRADARRGTIEVVTPKSEGATLMPERPSVTLSTLAVSGDKTPATIFIASLDSKDLPDSSRMLLIVASDAVNTGMSFADERRQVLETVGSLPVLARVVKVEVSLKHRRPGALRLWALAANGTRQSEIPVQTKDGRALTRIDTTRLVNGPTAYFEFALDPKP
ncbi:MAG: hypothetical protein HZA90_24125 [Verrucomicrobia bacterium]|nr:hypothetical protein [Verrucomicrobiota bacterium]